MAQKAQKTLAARNTAALNRTHLISLIITILFFLLRTFLLHRTHSLKPFILINLPAWLIEVWFERIGRPTKDAATGDLKRAGEDLEAKGLTEWMWDVLYWTWGCTVMAAVVGNRAWWLYLAVPFYSAYLAFSTYSGMRQGFAGMGGGDGTAAGGSGGSGGPSKRQAKMEKRGGQRVQYR
ncbi:hypothetical protein KC351_g7644 [Hortaea werneckii]|nr:hypothetical protein KC351_g7644 [Hortaea werneckii]